MKALVIGISFHSGPIGDLEGGSFTGECERWLKGALKAERLSLRELCEGNLEGGLYWGPWRMCNGRFFRQESLSIGAPLGNLEGGSSTADFVR